MTLILIILLILIFFGGGAGLYGSGFSNYQNGSWGLGGILVVVLIILLLTGRL